MPTVTFTSKGYTGTIIAGAAWARAKTNAGATYGVVGAGDWKPTIKPAVDRTALIAAGMGFGAGIDDTTDITGEVTFGTLTSGTRYDLIVARRVWGGTNATSFVAIPGSSTRGLPARSTTPGTQDDQPIALARIDGGVGGGTLAEIIDLRVWQANGGAVAADDLARSYITDVGTTLRIGSVEWTSAVDGLSNPVWSARHIDPNMVNDPTYGWIPRTLGGAAVVQVVAAGSAVVPLGRTVVGPEKYTWLLANGDGTAQPSLNVYAGQPTSPTTAAVRYTGGLTGGARINWIATYAG